MKKKQIFRQYISLEKFLSFTGAGVLCLAILATMYYIGAHYRFPNSPRVLSNIGQSVYYFGNILLLGGGFVLGLLLHKTHKIAESSSPLTSGVSFALLAQLVFLSFEGLRAIAMPLYEKLTYPWGVLIFSYMPLYSLIVTIVIGMIIKSRTMLLARSRSFMILLIILFALAQITMHASVFANSTGAVMDADTLMISLLGIIASPVAIFVATFLLLGRVASRLQRAFYATFVATTYLVAQSAIWNLLTSPLVQQMQMMSMVATIILLTGAVVFIWMARRAVAHDAAK